MNPHYEEAAWVGVLIQIFRWEGMDFWGITMNSEIGGRGDKIEGI